ncbi:hypothetical protein EJB05_51707, partial [Eragrostis curvula]
MRRGDANGLRRRPWMRLRSGETMGERGVVRRRRSSGVRMAACNMLETTLSSLLCAVEFHSLGIAAANEEASAPAFNRRRRLYVSGKSVDTRENVGRTDRQLESSPDVPGAIEFLSFKASPNQFYALYHMDIFLEYHIVGYEEELTGRQKIISIGFFSEH